MKAQLKADVALRTFEFHNELHFATEIAGFPDYFVTTSGFVITTKGQDPALLVNRNINGYMYVRLSNGDTFREQRVHRLVAKAFYEEPSSDRMGGIRNEVNHIDGDPMNNKVSNLEWCSSQENTAHVWGVLRSNDFMEYRYGEA
jgi:hypothetical protein